MLLKMSYREFKLGRREIVETLPLVKRYFSDIESSSKDAEGIQLGRGECIFLVGTPASGKSTYKNKILGSSRGVLDLDPDEIKLSHGEYVDDDVKLHVHHWSKEVMHNYFFDVVDSDEKPPFIWDTTGMDRKDMYLKMHMARRRGYKIYVVWVVIPREIAVVRNRRRKRYERDELFIWQALQKLEHNLELLIDAGHIAVSSLYVYSRYSGEELESAVAELARIPVEHYDKRPIEIDDTEKTYRRSPGIAIKNYEAKREVLLAWLKKVGGDGIKWREFVRDSRMLYREIYGKEFGSMEELMKFLRHFKPLFTRKVGTRVSVKTLERLGSKQASC